MLYIQYIATSAAVVHFIIHTITSQGGAAAMATCSCKQNGGSVMSFPTVVLASFVAGMKKDVTTSLGCHPMYNTTFKVVVVYLQMGVILRVIAKRWHKWKIDWKGKEVMQKIKHTLLLVKGCSCKMSV